LREKAEHREVAQYGLLDGGDARYQDAPAVVAITAPDKLLALVQSGGASRGPGERDDEYVLRCLRTLYQFATDMNCHVQVLAHPASQSGPGSGGYCRCKTLG